MRYRLDKIDSLPLEKRPLAIAMLLEARGPCRLLEEATKRLVADLEECRNAALLAPLVDPENAEEKQAKFDRLVEGLSKGPWIKNQERADRQMAALEKARSEGR